MVYIVILPYWKYEELKKMKEGYNQICFLYKYIYIFILYMYLHRKLQCKILNILTGVYFPPPKKKNV